MLQHNKIHNFFKQARWKQTYIQVLDLDEYNFLFYVFFSFEIIYGPRILFEALIF